MKLLSCHIENFGKLHDLSIKFASGENIFLRENGWGKTTLSAFLRTMFYGFSGKNKRRISENERRKYSPWQGGIYGGQLVFSTSAGIYRMERTFGQREKEDTFLLYDHSSGLLSSAFTENIGEELFGLDLDSFLHSVFISQQDIFSGATPSIHARMGNILPEEKDRDHYASAMALLKKEYDALSSPRSLSSVSFLKKELAERAHRIEQIPVLEEQLLRLNTEEDTLYQQLSSVQTDWVQRESAPILIMMQEWKECQEGRMELQNRREDLMLLKSRIENLENKLADTGHRIENLEGKKSPSLKDLLFLLPALIMFLLMLGSSVLFPARFRLLRNCTIAGTLLLLCLSAGIKKMARIRLLRQQAHYDTLSEQICSMKQDRTELAKKISGMQLQIDMKEKRILSFLEPYRKQEPETDVYTLLCRLYSQDPVPRKNSASLKTACSNFQQKISSVRTQYSETREQLSFLYDLREENPRMDLMLKTAEQKKLILEHTLNCLQEAKNRFSGQYLNPYRHSLEKYCSLLWEDKMPPLHADADLHIQVRLMGLLRDPSLLSTGTRDLIGICSRLAMIDVMFPKEKPFLILDDPLCNLDQDRVKKGLELLRKLSGDYQILYFTCHNSRVDSRPAQN